MDEVASVNILGVHVSQVSVKSLVDYISGAISNGSKVRAVYVNVHAINLAQDFTWFSDFLNGSEIAFCDGFGVKWGARLLGLRLPERLSPPDWIDSLVEACARGRFSIYMLGARPGVAEKVGELLKRKFPDLNIVGFQQGFFEKTAGCMANEAVVEAINQARPDILLVGLGMPTQERWLLDNWDHINVRAAVTVGALFDYLAGEFTRAPHWMTDHGLEWLARLVAEPRRLWRRYLLGNPRFLYLILRQRLQKISAKAKRYN
jgi:N-acetylglucosaminyldiphosphoundecaprenol N-acetyl-beta-D-mannosaminyltransferase